MPRANRNPLLAVLLVFASCRAEPPRPPDSPPPAPATSCCDPRPRAAYDEAPDPTRRTLERTLQNPPMVLTPRTHPRVGFPEHGSISIGTTTDGYLVNAAPLPLRGAHHQVMPEQATRRTNYGSDELVALVQDAAAAVAAEFPGAILDVGNAAKGGGGDIPWSVSHNTGLDVDLSFYLVDAAGQAVHPTTLVHIRRDGTCQEIADCRLDIPKTWALVAALVSHPRAALQWIFVARWIRTPLLAHARTAGASAETIARAGALLHQPSGALPHDDHLHLRLYCPREDVLEGCLDRGPVHAWAPGRADEREQRIDAVVRLLRNTDPSVRAGAAELVRLLSARRAGDALVRLLDDPVLEVRAAATRTARALRLEAAVPRLRARLATESDPAERLALVRALAAIGGASAGSALQGLLGDRRAARAPAPFDGEGGSVASEAARALGRMGERRAAAALVAALDAGDPQLAAASDVALRALTAHTPRPTESAAIAKDWRAWWQKNRSRRPDDWLLAGLREAGYRVPSFDVRGLSGLLAAVRDGRPWVSDNARRAIARLARDGHDTTTWSREDAWRYWFRWCVRRHGAKRCR